MDEVSDNWLNLRNCYGKSFDPRPWLRKITLEEAETNAWATLWSELHHQSNVCDAAYASVSLLVQLIDDSKVVNWNPYALISTIEVERYREGNPRIPKWIEKSYFKAWERIPDLGTRDLTRTRDCLAVRSINGALALAKGDIELGAFISTSDSSEIEAYLDESISWKKRYFRQST